MICSQLHADRFRCSLGSVLGPAELTFAVLTQAGVNDVATDYAQQQLAALDVRKRFKPLTVLKANKGKAAPGVTLAQRPTRGTCVTGWPVLI